MGAWGVGIDENDSVCDAMRDLAQAVRQQEPLRLPGRPWIPASFLPIPLLIQQRILRWAGPDASPDYLRAAEQEGWLAYGALVVEEGWPLTPADQALLLGQIDAAQAQAAQWGHPRERQQVLTEFAQQIRDTPPEGGPRRELLRPVLPRPRGKRRRTPIPS
jgi:hypothetical protein